MCAATGLNPTKTKGLNFVKPEKNKPFLVQEGLMRSY
jgi:hypothetical protein